jgi:hypothetical protein
MKNTLNLWSTSSAVERHPCGAVSPRGRFGRVSARHDCNYALITGTHHRNRRVKQSSTIRRCQDMGADAKATEIYARAYNQSPEAVAFYEFTRTMQSYKSIIAENTTLVLSTDSDLFKFLKSMIPGDSINPVEISGDRQ